MNNEKSIQRIKQELKELKVKFNRIKQAHHRLLIEFHDFQKEVVIKEITYLKSLRKKEKYFKRF